MQNEAREMVVVFVFGARRKAMIGGMRLQKQIYADNTRQATTKIYSFPLFLPNSNLCRSSFFLFF